MKKLWTLILISFILTVQGAVLSYGQANISTRKMKLGDFTSKTTRIVATGNELFDIPFREEVSRRWHVSPFEFCTQAEYEASKTNPDYYFLSIVDSRRKKEETPGITMIELVKGGAEDQTIEVVSFPFCPATNPSGREFIYLPAILNVIQDYALKVTTSDLANLGGLNIYARKNAKFGDKKLIFSSGDLTGDCEVSESWGKKNTCAMEEDDADIIFTRGDEDCIVSYTVSPEEPQKGSVSYQMLFTADTHELYYFDKHNISERAAAGFSSGDVKQILILKKK